jgi:hypothetical protein
VDSLDAKLREQLLDLGRAAAQERGWEWREPVEISSRAYHGEPVWELRSNFMMLGGNVIVLIRKSDLATVHAGSMPR